MALLDPGKYNVLSIRGGGVKGLVPAMLLAELERETGMPCREMFSLFTGTSTGAILAYALAQGIPASDLVDFYMSKAPRIFKRRWLTWGVLRGKYDIRNLQEALYTVFGNTTFNRGKHCMVCATETEYKRSVMFKNWKHEYATVYAWEAISASCAAPTFFDPVKIKNVGILVDGGLFANNPAPYAMTQALKLIRKHPDLLVDLACPASMARISEDDSPSITGAKDIGEIVSTMMDVGMDANSTLCSEHLGARYVCVQPHLGLASSSMDDASDSNLKELQSAGKQQKHTLISTLL